MTVSREKLKTEAVVQRRMGEREMLPSTLTLAPTRRGQLLQVLFQPSPLLGPFSIS